MPDAPVPEDVVGGLEGSDVSTDQREPNVASLRVRGGFLADSLGWALAAAAVVLVGAIGLASYFLLIHRERVAAPLPALSAEAAGWLGDRQEVAVFKDGKLFLYGSAHSHEEREAMIALANSLTGPENVVTDEYFVDPRRPARRVTTMRVADPVLFELDSADIAPAFEPVLNFVAGMMVTNPRVSIAIVGHTDELGDDHANLVLSQTRAQAALAAIVARGGDPARLLAEGRGETQPIGDNNDPLGRQMNRRVEFQLSGF
ncbi:MAG: OmpA family protein [Acidimicrobiales bacterium]